MRAVTVTEKYNAVLEGKMAKKEFVRQMRQQYPMYISQFSGFDDTVQILTNRQMLYETPKPAFSEAKVYDDRPALTYSLDALDRGIRIELEAKGITTFGGVIKPEDFYAAEKKAKSNLEKDPNHYLNLMSGESNKVDKHDKMKETKRGAKDTDVMNGLKKATLKEEVKIQKEEFEMSEDAKKNLLGQVVGALRTKYPEITAGIVKDFIKTHYQDLLDGADIEGEFEEYIYANYETASDFREAKGKDHDGDGDIDGDDYMSAKDKAIKKAMGKEEQLKEAIKSIIKKTLLNEAATVKLADWAESYETFPGVKPVVNELENIVTEIETFYDKMSDKISKVFEKSSDFENEEGLKIGGFIAPGLEAAFKQDLSKVIKKGSFFNKINLPKVRTITQADVDAHNSGERPLGEEDVLEEPKSTVFTPNF